MPLNRYPFSDIQPRMMENRNPLAQEPLEFWRTSARVIGTRKEVDIHMHQPSMTKAYESGLVS
jgi:hypothetical protein